MSDEAPRLLAEATIAALECVNPDDEQELRATALMMAEHVLAQPIPAAREAVLLDALKEMLGWPSRRKNKKARALIADTSPAAEALLAQGERIKTARGKVMMIDASPAGSLNAQLKAEALAALAPGEEKE